MKSNQKGIAHLGLLLLLLVIVVIGSVGWYVWQKRDGNINSFEECVAAGYPVMQSRPEQCYANGETFYGDSSNLPTVTTFKDCKKAGGRIQESYPEVCVFGTKNFTNLVQAGYLVIQEWGIKVTVVHSDKLTYEIFKEGGTHPSSGEKYLESASIIVDLTDSTDKNCERLGLSIFKSDEPFMDYVKIGNYYYAVTGGPGRCEGESDADWNLETEIMDSLRPLKIESL